jgi:hypothetical protein
VRRTIVPPEITALIGACRLTRQGVVRLLSMLHGELPQQYGRFRNLRHPEDERLFFYFVALFEEGVRHTFTFTVDDSTSAEHLLIADLEHEARATGQ